MKHFAGPRTEFKKKKQKKNHSAYQPLHYQKQKKTSACEIIGFKTHDQTSLPKNVINNSTAALKRIITHFVFSTLGEKKVY